MTLNQRYRIYGVKKASRYLKLFIIIAFLLMFSQTFASYSSMFVVQSDFNVAKWKIVINGTEVNENIKTLNNAIELKSDDNIIDGLIKAGQTGYFDISINPDGTEVSLEYSIAMDFSNMPDKIVMNSYSIIKDNEESEKMAIPSDNSFNGTIYLKQENNVKYRLDSSDTITYRIYWTWSGEDYEIEYNTYSVTSNITVQQIIS